MPTPPGEFVIVRSTNSLNISWARPLNMSSVSHYFQLSYSNSTLNCSQNYSSLMGLSAGVQYNISVRTVGAMGYFSSPQYLTAYTSKQCKFVFFFCFFLACFAHMAIHANKQCTFVFYIFLSMWLAVDKYLISYGGWKSKRLLCCIVEMESNVCMQTFCHWIKINGSLEDDDNSPKKNNFRHFLYSPVVPNL